VKIFKRILIGLALFLAIFLLVAFITIRVAFPPEKIAAIIREQGTEILGRPVGLKSVNIRVFPGIRVSANEVELANAPGFSKEPAVRLERLDLSVNLWSLLKFSPVIHEVRLVKPDILFEVDSAGNNNLEGLGAQDSVPDDTAAITLPANVALESFVLENGRVRYRDVAAGQEITLGRIDQQASLTADRTLSDVRSKGSLEIAEISVKDSALGLRKGGVRITVAHDLRLDLPGDSVSLTSVRLSFQDVKATLTGRVRGLTSDAQDLDLKFSAPSVSLASLFQEVPPELNPEIRKLSVAGTASLEARVQGVLDSVNLPRIVADVTVRDGAFGHQDVPQGVEKFTMDLKVRGDTATLDSLTFATGPNPVRMTVLLTSILDSIPRLERFALDGRFDLGNLTGLARAMGFLDNSILVSGIQTVAVKASGPLNPARPEALTVSGDARSIGVKVRMEGIPPVTVDGSTRFDNAKIHQQLKARIGNSDAAVNAVVTGWLAFVLAPDTGLAPRPHVRADVRSNLLDLDELMGVQTTAEDTSAPLTEWPEFPPVDVDATVSLARTKLMNLEMTAFTLKTALRARTVAADLKGTLYSGGFTSHVALTRRSAQDMGVGFKLNVARVEANDFISRLNDHVPLKNKLLKSLAGTDNSVFGKFNLDMNITTSGLPAQFAERASGPAVFSISDGKLVGIEWTKSLSGALAKAHSSLGFQEFNFSALKGDLLLDKGKVQVRDFSFDGSRAGSARAQGFIGLDNALNLTLTHTLPPEASKAVAGGSSAVLAQVAKVSGSKAVGGSLLPTDASGRAMLYYLVRGEVTRPSFGLDAQRMAKEGAAGAAGAAAKAALQAKLQQQQDALKAQAQAEKEKLEAATKARIEAEKKKAKEEGAKKGKKVLKDLGF
jgi:uncharacterized protein involved in outer membrane biogenesis